MNKLHLLMGALIILALSVASPSAAQIQVPRTFVSIMGNDRTPCDSPQRPCQSIQSAIDKVMSGGEVVVLTSGSYQPFIVSKSVSVVVVPGAYAGISASSGNGITVTGSPTEGQMVVVLRGLSLKGMGAERGIVNGGAKVLHIENCTIEGFTIEGILFHTNGDAQLFVSDTVVRNNGGDGIAVRTDDGIVYASINRSRAENNGHGFWARENARVTVRDSESVGNHLHGFRTEAAVPGTTAELTIENSIAAGNGAGIVEGEGTSIIRVSNSTITHNSDGGIFVVGEGSVLSRGDNTVEGNGGAETFTGTFTTK